MSFTGERFVTISWFCPNWGDISQRRIHLKKFFISNAESGVTGTTQALLCLEPSLVISVVCCMRLDIQECKNIPKRVEPVVDRLTLPDRCGA